MFEHLTSSERSERKRTLTFPFAVGAVQRQTSRNVGRGLVHTKHVLVVQVLVYVCQVCVCIGVGDR